MIKRKLLILSLFLSFMSSYAQIDLPYKWAMGKFYRVGLDKLYQIDNYLKPTALQADFNGDGEVDIAFVIFEKASQKKGIIIFHANADTYFILGAGQAFQEVGDDFTWTSKWALYKKASAHQAVFDKKTGDIIGTKKVKLIHPGIQILDEGGDGCIIYWDGIKYISIHHGE